MTFRNIALGILFFLFIACFVAIVVEELFIGGRRKRQLLKKAAVGGTLDGERKE